MLDHPMREATSAGAVTIPRLTIHSLPRPPLTPDPSRLTSIPSCIIDELFHAPAHGGIGQPAVCRAEIVDDIFRLGHTGDRAGDRRMRNNVLEKKLRPRLAVELARPFRQFFPLHRVEQPAAAEGLIDHHGYAAIAGQG